MTSSEILMAVFTAVIATTGVIGAIIFNGQLSIMQGQLTEMKTQAVATTEANIASVKSLQQSNRPWVVVDLIELARPISFEGDRDHIRLNLNLKNTVIQSPLTFSRY